MKLRKVIVDCTKCKSNKQRVYTRYKSGFQTFCPICNKITTYEIVKEVK